MKGFKITVPGGPEIRFRYYAEEAPVTCEAFHSSLPFIRTFLHARLSGREIWIDDAPYLEIIQENASVFTEPGEAVIGPSGPARNRIAGCFGVYYGGGKGLDAANIFAQVVEEDMQHLKDLGDRIWKHGGLQLIVEAWHDETPS
jgi:hypothetical protein